MAPLLMRMLTGAWLSVPLKIRGFLVQLWLRLLIWSVSSACEFTLVLGQGSKRRSGVTGLDVRIFRGAWGSLKISLFLTPRIGLIWWCLWHLCVGVIGWGGDNLELNVLLVNT